MRASSKCRSCGADVRWCITAASGKRMPVDVEPVPDGNVWVDRIEQGTPIVEVVLTGADVPANIALRYQSHFVSCPDSASWRRT